MKKYDTYNIFTPSQPASELTFVDREIVNKQLVNALRTPGKQLIIYGHSGSGKSSLLNNKINQLFAGCIQTLCTKSTTIEQIKLSAFDQLDKYYISSSNNSKSIGKSVSLKSTYLDLKSESKIQKDDRLERIVPMQLTNQRLAQLIGETGFCWKIEDFHKVNNKEKQELAQMMKGFMDTSTEYPTTKIVVIGAVGTGKEVVEYDSEMRNRISEIFVPLMSLNELEKIITIGEKLLNIEFSKKTKSDITLYSNGLGSVCHQLCLSMCENNEIFNTQSKKHLFSDRDLENAIKDYLNDNSASLKSTLDKALKTTKESKYDTKEVLKAIISLSELEEVSYSEILLELRKENPVYPAQILTTYLNQLITIERGEILRFNKDGNLYSFNNPFFKTFFKLAFRNEPISSNIGINQITKDEFNAFLIAKRDILDEFGD